MPMERQDDEVGLQRGPVEIGGQWYSTTEIIQDDGTYGDSGEYLYWRDQSGQYHQQYLSAGVMIHVSDKPDALAQGDPEPRRAGG